jgi:hypothetical protein
MANMAAMTKRPRPPAIDLVMTITPHMKFRIANANRTPGYDKPSFIRDNEGSDKSLLTGP